MWQERKFFHSQDRFRGLEVSADGNDTENEEAFRRAGPGSQQLLQWPLLQGFTARKQRQWRHS